VPWKLEWRMVEWRRFGAIETEHFVNALVAGGFASILLGGLCSGYSDTVIRHRNNFRSCI
jgi:hypothetical protein